MNAPEVVRRYAVTLLEAAEETQVRQRVEQDVEGLLATFRESRELGAFVDDRLVSGQAHCRVLREIFGGRIQPLTLNFLLLVCQRRRAYLLPRVLEVFQELAEARAGVVRAEVRSAVGLSPGQVERLGERLAGFSGRQVRLQAQVDPGLRGGLVVRVGDTVFDGTVAAQLERLRRRLVGR